MENKRWFRPVIILGVLALLANAQIVHSYYENKKELDYYKQLLPSAVAEEIKSRQANIL